MTRILAFLIFTAATVHAAAPHLQPLAFEVIHDDRIVQRNATDKRYSVWTDKASEADPLLRSLGIESKHAPLKAGYIMAVFLNDSIKDDLTAVIYNQTAHQTFADYADSGIEIKLKAPEEGKKYTHITVVVFAPVETPSHLGLRGMISGGLSEKK